MFRGVLILVTLAHVFSKSDLPPALGTSTVPPDSSCSILSFLCCTFSLKVVCSGKQRSGKNGGSFAFLRPCFLENPTHCISCSLPTFPAAPSPELGKTRDHGEKSRQPSVWFSSCSLAYLSARISGNNVHNRNIRSLVKPTSTLKILTFQLMQRLILGNIDFWILCTALYP